MFEVITGALTALLIFFIVRGIIQTRDKKKREFIAQAKQSFTRDCIFGTGKVTKISPVVLYLNIYSTLKASDGKKEKLGGSLMLEGYRLAVLEYLNKKPNSNDDLRQQGFDEAEFLLFIHEGNVASVKAHFKNSTPITLEGVQELLRQANYVT